MTAFLKRVARSKARLPLATLLVGLCVAVGGGLWSKRQVDDSVKVELDRAMQHVSVNLTQRFTLAHYGLAGVRGLYAASERVSRKEFIAYVASRNMPKEFPGVRGFGFIERVGRDGLDAFVAAERADDAPQFSIRQLEDRSQADLYVIKLIEPPAANAGAEGLDVGSEANRRAALLRAIDTGEATMSHAVQLVQDRRKTPGVLLFLPHYKPGANLSNVAERRAALLGLTYAPIVFSELLDSLPTFANKEIDFELFGTDADGTGETLYYDADNHLAKLGDGQLPSAGYHHSASRALPLFGHVLTLRVNSLPAFEARFEYKAPWFVFATLALLSVLAALLLRLQASGLQRSEQRAHQMTEQLRWEEARWRDFSTGASDWFWETDAEHFYRFMSDNFEQFYGRPFAQLINWNLKELLKNDSLNSPDLIKEQLRRIDQHLPLTRFELQMRVADGSVRWLVLSALPQLDAAGRFFGYRGNGSDITERKRTEADLVEQRRRLSDILEGTNVGTWEWNVQTGALLIDERWANLIGFELAELMPVSLDTWIKFTHPQDQELSDRLLEAHFTGKSDYYECEARMRAKDGHWVWLLGRGRVSSWTDDGKPILMSGTHQDISKQKAIQVQLAEAHLQADAANLAKTAFLANMSHEIRSPLNAILGLAYLLEQASLEQEPREMVRKIRDSGRMLLGIISDILDMSKIEAGQMLVEHAPFDLDTVLDNVATALGLSIGAKEIEPILSPLPSGVRSIVGDATRLQQVLINLASNAAKFTQVGRIEVRIELIGRTDGTEWLRFAVHDTGIGIAPELQGGVFSAFVQADTSTTRRFGGTGLGLAICRQLVSLMGGEIGLNSVPGEGSEFWFTLPLERIDLAKYSSPSLVQLEVLIVDDSDVALQAIGAVAQNLGWQASKVDSGAAAVANVLERDGTKRPDVVVLDWKMPGMDGLAVARAIRAGVLPSECPIVIMATAQSLTTLANQEGAKLADALLSKPVTASALYNAVQQAQLHRAATQGTSPSVLRAAGDLLAGVRLLVVDDSDINRDVAQRILSSQGATVTLAENGQQAIDWLLAHPFDVDLVLMDVQMPVLDGMEATRRLRRLDEFDDLPIVALTAGAFRTQQQAAIAAGMTEFVSKPFDVPLTVALIRRLRRPPKLIATMPGAAAPPGPPARLAYGGTGAIDEVLGLEIWSDLPTYQTYLRRFSLSYSDAVETIRSCLASGDRPGAAALAHKLAGVAANLALPDTRRAAQEAEQLLAAQDDPELALVELSKALVAVLAEINRYAPEVEQHQEAPDAAGVVAAAFSAPEKVALKKQLTQFLQALDSDNPVRVRSEMMTLEQQLPATALAAIKVSVLDYDFRGAEACTRQLAIDYAIEVGD